MDNEKLHLKLSVEELTFDEMIDIQEGNLRRAKAILVKFAVDENGRPMAAEQAGEAIGKLSITQMQALFSEFGQQVATAMQETLPNGRGRR